MDSEKHCPCPILTFEIWICFLPSASGNWLLVMKSSLVEGMKTPASWARGWDMYVSRQSSLGFGPNICLNAASWMTNGMDLFSAIDHLMPSHLLIVVIDLRKESCKLNDLGVLFSLPDSKYSLAIPELRERINQPSAWYLLAFL